MKLGLRMNAYKNKTTELFSLIQLFFPYFFDYFQFMDSKFFWLGISLWTVLTSIWFSDMKDALMAPYLIS